jgi:hypothetical protein
MKNLRIFKERGKAFRHLLGKKQLATFAAILCLMAMMPLTARAETINTVTSSEQLTKSSTVYVGEVVVDGVSKIKYLYSGDMTLSSVCRQNLLDGLNGMADGDYSALLEANWPTNSAPQVFAFCSDATLAAAMDENWSSAQYVGNLYYSDKTVASEINSNLYDIDNGFKAVVDAQIADRIATIDNPIDAEKCIVSHLGTNSSSNVYYTVENGQPIKHVDTYVVFSSEATTVIYTKVELETPMIETPLTFEAVEEGTITVNLDDETTLEAIQYKLNDAEWTDVSWNTPIALAANGNISFRGDNGTCNEGEDSWVGFHFEPSNPVYVYGNMMSLIDKDNFETNTTLTETYTFFHLFQRSDYEPNTAILNHPTKDIVLPATTLTANCYDGLFDGCPGITRVPELPATTLASWCYCMMFSGTGITNAPALPATTLADNCYADMFMNCTSLTTAPDLPAATLVEGCYTDMFAGCTALNYVKCLATDITADICTASWLDDVAATGTFVKSAIMEDWALNDPSGIPEGWTVEDDPYTEPLTFEAINSAYIQFKTNSWSVSGLQYRKYTASSDTWSDWSNVSSNNFYSLSAGDKFQFKKENNEPLANSADHYCSFQNPFGGDCYVYGNVMSLFNFATAFESDYACDKLFSGNTNLHNHTTKELILGATTLSSCCYSNMFKGCTNLTKAPALPATSLANSCYSNMFKGCTNLTKAPALPATSLAHSCYWGMFDGCTGLTTAPELPATTLASYCYNYMFQNCTSLTTAPELPAATLQELSYDYMFHGCTNLNYVKCFATDISAFNCTLGWLYGVAATGTFVKANGTNWTLDDPSGIPAGWTVEAIDVFTTEGDWDVAANWSANAVPTDGSDVAIMANATVPNGCMANAGNVSLYGSTLTIADGGQLIHSNAVNATLQKEIVGFGNDNSVPTGWYTIASPLAENFTPTDDMLTEVYDLYYYDEPNALWKNHKQNSFVIEPQKGYLYANSNNKTLAFTGEMQATTNTVTVPLSYLADGNLKGYNLVGNPFTCNVTGDITLGGAALTSYYIADGSVTNEGANLIACNIVDRAIKPGEGFFVQATAANQDLVFNPAAKGEAATKPAFICIESGNDSFMDRAYVQIGHGNTLRKMSLNDNTAKVYVMDDGKDYAAATIEAAVGEMPVHFKAAKNDTYTINVNAKHIDLAYLHLIDNLTGADVDLLENPSYTFAAKTTDYASRFRLVFSNCGDAVGDNDMPFAFINNGNIIVNGEGTLQVMDVMGHIVCQGDARHCVSTGEMATGVYVLRLIQGQNVKTQKIVLE